MTQTALTFSEACKFLNVSKATLERWIKRGLIPPPFQKAERGHRVFAVSDLQGWAAAHPKEMTRAHARMLDAAEQRTKAEREAVKVKRAKEAGRATRKAQKQATTPLPVFADTADSEGTAVHIDPLLRLAHAPRTPRHPRFIRNRQRVNADNDPRINESVDRKLGIGGQPRINWHL